METRQLMIGSNAKKIVLATAINATQSCVIPSCSNETYIQYNAPIELPTLFKEKKFKCKGKGHQYSLISEKYICTCGKELNNRQTL